MTKSHRAIWDAFRTTRNITVKTHQDTTVLRHDGIAILTVLPDEQIILSNGGMNRPATKQFLNRALQAMGLKARVSQENFAWYLYTESGEKKPFVSGMVVHPEKA